MIVRARAVRLIPLVIAVAATAVGAHVLSQRPPDPGRSASYLAYRVTPGRGLAFPLEEGEQDLAVTVQVNGAPEGEVTPFAVDTLLRDAAGKVMWSGRASLAAGAGAEIVEGGAQISVPRTLRLPAIESARQLVVTVDGGGGLAVVRLTHRETEARSRQVSPRASVFGPDYLDEETREVLYARPLRRRAAADEQEGVELVHVRLGRAVPPASDAEPPGEEVDALAAVAYTVRGPGSVRVSMVPVHGEATAATLRTVDHLGRQMVLPVPVVPRGSEAVFVAPAGGALTVEVLGAYAPVRVRVMTAGGATRLGADATTEIVPDRRRVVLWRAHPAGPPVIATLAGDGTARVEARPAVGGGRVARLAWRLVDGERGEIARGQVAVAAVPTPFDRLRPHDGEPVRPACEPMSFAAAGPPGSRLELSALDAPIDLALLAADDEAVTRLTDAYLVPLTNARLRHAPLARRRHEPFLPDNHAALAVSAGKVVLEGQVRLEPALTTVPAGPFRSLEPAPPRNRQLMVERDDDARGDLARWAFAMGETARLVAPLDGRVVLETHLGDEALGQTLRVVVDGKPVEERRVNVTRSRVRLHLSPGAHEVAVEGPRGFVLTPAVAVDGAKAFAERAVWRLPRGGSLAVPVALAGAKNLNVVLYTDAPARLQARVEIDGGRRGNAMRPAAGRTVIVRLVEPQTMATESRWLDQRGGAGARARFAVRLADDVGGGRHQARVTLLSGPETVYARFFVTGAAPSAEKPGLTTEWAED